MKKVALIVILLSVSNMVCSQSDCTNYDSIGDYTTAFSCYMSDTLNPHKQYKIGEYYYEGKVVDKDYNKAVEYFSKAAEQDNSTAQYMLSVCYQMGMGVNKDMNQVAYWSQKAAEGGNVTAMYNLANCYYYGRGIEKDYHKALHWYTKAANQGHQKAKKGIENATKKLQEEQ